MTSTDTTPPIQGTKRPHDEVDDAAGEAGAKGDESESESDDDFGPALPSAGAPKKKKRRKLPYEKQYIAALPSAPRYSKSLMHKEQLAFCTFTPHTDFLITSSVDGFVKFWKKVTGGIEFVKEFKAHNGEIKSVSVSADGRGYATAGTDGTVKIFDVVNFDLLAMLEPELPPKSVCFVNGSASSDVTLAVSNETDGRIMMYDGRGEIQQPLHTISGLHRKPVNLMVYNNAFDCVISTDESGMVEYWRPSGSYEKPANVFDMKSSTSLFEFKKAKSVPSAITISPTGTQFATFSFPDRKVRVFDFATGKLYRTYDESIQTVTEMQQAGTLSSEPLEAVEFGRRIAVERELENALVRNRANVIFDESGNFILYGSILGTKVVNTLSNRVVKIYGRHEAFRPINLTLYQGQPDKKGIITVQMAASDNPLLQQAEARDSMLTTTAANKSRFYMFTADNDAPKSDRDIHNEKPKNIIAQKQAEEKALAESRMSSTATIHTTLGDIHVRMYPQHAPKAVENFTQHAKKDYYNGIIFHRVIRKFMIQTGDPLGDGTGGESIWGKEFEDEFTPALRHDKPYMLSMANAGPGTNASQFFVTTDKAPWLDDKHTIFGRCVKGMDVVHLIENARVFKEKPVDDIKIISVSVD
jgi:peptidylprolyl isomerase domain and WD repeat-containing protein 1